MDELPVPAIKGKGNGLCGRVVGVAEAFGLGLDKWERFIIYDNVELRIGPCARTPMHLRIASIRTSAVKLRKT
jgi:hypothetical protein